MKIEQCKEIADAVLYEGYLLYPYRRSAIKNRQRWTFGVVYSQEYSEANGGIEPWTMHTECLLRTQGNKDTSLDIYVRFLHLLSVWDESEHATSPAPDVKSTWEEAIEREVSALGLRLSDLLAHARTIEINFPGDRIIEVPPGSASSTVREQKPLRGAIIISAEQAGEDCFKLIVQIENKTPGTRTITNRGDLAVLHSFVSTHTLLQVHQGAFISLLESDGEIKPLIEACQNRHTWPVLIGNEGEQDGMLSSPIILYDYPQIAPESPGPLFDGTEIDEILTLRIMTLTDEEKREMREGDGRAREILERTEQMSPEQFMKLHGVIRSLRPVDEGGEA